jgi:predicted GH43/DUF377 family glycosyl hydrolase
MKHQRFVKCFAGGVVSALVFVSIISWNSGKRASTSTANESQTMMYSDTSRKGTPWAKDPHVIFFNGRYLIYYTIPSYADQSNPIKGMGIGIAESHDLINWKRVGEIVPTQEYEVKGIAAPCAKVIGGKVHLFYQTYSNRRKDSICHAWSDDGITFTRNATNPIFHPDGKWNWGRAIDAEVIRFRDKYLIYFATRDTAFRIQMLGVAVAPANTSFNREDWEHISVNGPILKPELPWEKNCIEAPSVIERNGKLYMFYAGAYNNEPQQIGVAVSSDGIAWERLSDQPFLKNGEAGSWNSSESGHPHIFEAPDGRTFLFYQGNNDHGKTWYLSNIPVKWDQDGPSL